VAELKTNTADFLQYLTQERRLSPHTISNYQRDLKRFLVFCQQQDLTAWPQIKSSHIRQFMAQCHQQGLGGRSIQRLLSSLRSLYGYLIKMGLAKMNPAQSVQAPKAAQRLPATLDVDQMNSLLAYDEMDWRSCRDKAMMELLYSSGLRLAELASLNMGDIEMREGMVKVTGKGNKERVVPVGKQALIVLKQWHTHRDTLGFAEQPALFISQQGKRLGMRAIQKRLQYWGQKQGVSEQVHPHRLRHAFASHVLESSGDLRAVQELLGHADISTTQIYTHVDFQQLAKVYDAAHPRARKK
jgi:integrase/recombinase XerC